MNPLTLVKRIQKINSREAALGVSEEASWHAKYKDSAYVFVGGIPFDLTEGDLLAVFAQYGEIVDVNLVRDKATGKSKGFAFVAYEDQRSTNLAVDNLNGAQILGRVIRVDHVNKYKKKEEEDEQELQRQREERGVCRAFQRGECSRGASCKFSHDEQRAANTGWGAEDKEQRWGHDKYAGLRQVEKESGKRMKEYPAEPKVEDTSRSCGTDYHSAAGDKSVRGDRKEQKRSRRHGEEDTNPKSGASFDRGVNSKLRRHEENDAHDLRHRDRDRSDERRMYKYEDDVNGVKSMDRCHSREENRSRRDDDGDDRSNSRSRGNRQTSEGKGTRRQDSKLYAGEDRDGEGGERRSVHGRDRSSRRHER